MSWPVPSLTTILSGIFVAWILNSMWTIYGIFNPPSCDGGVTCLNPSFKPQETVTVSLYGKIICAHLYHSCIWPIQ